jgi:hypothetical protein
MVEYLYSLDYQIEGIHNSVSGNSVNNEVSPEQSAKSMSQETAAESGELPDTLASEEILSDVLGNGVLRSQLTSLLDPQRPGLCIRSPFSPYFDVFTRRSSVYIRAYISFAAECREGADSTSYNSKPRQDRGLRDLAVKIRMDHMIELRTGGETALAAFEDKLVEQVPRFSYDLPVAVLNKSVSDWDLDGVCRKNWSVDGFGWD